MAQEITILTGKKSSGKTTWLLNNYCIDKNVAGILTPIVNGKRVFNNIMQKDIFEMEFNNKKGDKLLSVGKYNFSSIAFEKASDILLAHIGTTTEIIIDEIGPLELRNFGFANTLKLLLKQENLKMLIVVRDELVAEVVDYFSIQRFKIIQHS